MERAFPLRCMREVTGFHLEFYQRDVTDGTLSPCNFLQSLRRWSNLRRNPRKQCSLLSDWFYVHLHGGRRGGLSWTRSGSRMGTVRGGFTLHVYTRDESARLFIEMSLMKEAKAERANVVHAHST